MASKREQILSALFSDLLTLQTTSVSVYRNLDNPQKVEGGLIIMRDGASEQPEVLLSPLTYIYQHLVHLEVLVQNPDSSLRNSQLDALLNSIGTVITTNRSLGGIAEWIEAEAPAFIEQPIEGAPTVKMATLSVMVRFTTNDSLN
ncbi:MAG: acyl-CoA transferase [Pseudomonadota bacterium]|nr:acyl-CoA transferase [Pseudomonadota bacterium]MDE3038512.1 acyl-CoA transferase [Pseudomonadota bacterium]